MNALLKRVEIPLVLLLLTFLYHPAACEDSNTEPRQQPYELKTQQPLEYRVSPNDILEVNVYQEPDLSLTARVTARGYISYPLLGQVNVAGLTVAEVEDKITSLLKKDYLVNPQVTIFIREFDTRTVAVMGAVANPGSYKIPSGRPLTLMQAISVAGGFSRVANPKKVRIIRWEDGKESTKEVNTRDITGGGEVEKDIPLQPDDIVYVPESFF